jgi:pimeloyl-ACP methyl ester carboxylesterase
MNPTLTISTPRPAMNTIVLNGTDFACARRGAGETVILVHGAVGDFRTWDAQMSLLSSRYDVLAYSRRGHFPATNISSGIPYNVEAHAQDLVALILAQGGRPVRLVGHSYGGAVCAAVALACPQLVRSMVLAEASLFSLLLANREGAYALAQSAASMTHVAPLIRQGKVEKGLDEFLDVILGPGGAGKITGFARQVMMANAHTLDAMLNGMNGGGQFTDSHAAQIKTPTLILSSELTPPFFKLTSDLLEQHIPGAERVVLSGISHGLQLEDPEGFSREVLRFFARH